ncbi:hypothetical protein BVI2075_100072 [Burkholderia vietnamiensis]|nr:hypothetical protein BVI2075_100072 [Burkholderia vietnamiensis]
MADSFMVENVAEFAPRPFGLCRMASFRGRRLRCNMHSALHDAEPVGDERRVGQCRVGGRVRAGAVEVGERGRLVDEYAARQVDRQRDAAANCRFVRSVEHVGVGAVDGQRQRAVLGGDFAGEIERLRGRVGRDHERDRAEPLLRELRAVSHVELHHERRAHASVGEGGMHERLAVGEHAAELAGVVDARAHAFVLDRADQLDGACSVAGQLLHGAGYGLGHVVEARMAIRGLDAVTRYVDVLRSRAHLARVQRQRERDVLGRGLEVVGRVDHDLVDAGFLRVHLRLVSMAFEPRAVLRTAGEVDQLDFGAQREVLHERAVVRLGREQRDDVRIEAGFAQHVAGDADRDRERQDRARVRLDDHRVAGGEVGEQAGVAIPGRERAAAEHEAGAARDDRIALVHRERRVLALRLFPMRIGGDSAQLVPGIGDCFERTILRVRAAGLECHHEGLARRMHHAVGDLEARAIQPCQDFEADADPCARAGFTPLKLGRGCRGDQLVGRRFWIADVERDPVWRLLRADGPAGRRLVELEHAAEMRFERGFAIGVRAFPVHFGTRHFRKRAPVPAALDGGEGVFQRVFVLREQCMGHDGSLMDSEKGWID